METLKIRSKNKEQVKTVKAFLNALKIPFEVSQESPYDPQFVAKIKESEREAAQGMVKAVKTGDLWR